MRLFVCLWLVLTVCTSANSDEVGKLIPGQTYAVIVGVLTWQEKSLTEYPAERRQDVALQQQLAAIGVPAENVTVLLDQAATRDAIETAVTSVAKRAGEDSTLIIYYAGHGMTHDGKGVFACFDIDTQQMAQTGWCHDRLAESIKSNFGGDNVLLFADCCYSGKLQDVAKQLGESGFRAASLSSAGVDNLSTSNWTFTLSLVEALSGHPLSDVNVDGAVTLGETAVEVKEAMRFFERQRSGFASHQLPEEFQLATTRRDPILTGAAKQKQILQYKFGQFVLAKPNQKWAIGRVLSQRISELGKPELLIQSQDYSDRPTHWLGTDKVRLIDAVVQKQFPPDPLPDDEAQQKASVDGKYTNLLAKLKVETDWKSYGAFQDFGNWAGKSYFQHKDLPAGHWVYVYPHWYIWQTNIAGEVAVPPNVAPLKNVPHWDAKQMIGRPDTLQPGDQITAWAPGKIDDGKVWAEVDFGEAIVATEIHIYENCSPGAVYQITGFVDAKEIVLWKGTDPTPASAAMGTSKFALSSDVTIDRIRIYVDCKRSAGWNEIDAVALIDRNNKEHWAVDARASCTYNQAKVIAFVDPFQADADRKAEKWAEVKKNLRDRKQRIRQYEAAIEEERKAIKMLYEEMNDL
ncbi:caspase family protein [Planctomycetes bacterium K23_9]|uniref:Caspase domain protein n=1 Tax=Stieleria marina TaxID=1930275 RepID=A0A517NPS7_9BACT|nr:Caspase domain protein [Planctomycetes bacterium K23_9]